jgi:hypothetical protein
MTIPNTVPWATPDDVAALTGATVTDAQIADGDRRHRAHQRRPSAAMDPTWVSPRVLDWLRRAVAYQTAWILAHPDYFERMDLKSLSQDGVSAVFKGDSIILAPLARRCLNRLPWRGTRTITPSINRTADRAGYRDSNAPDLPDVAAPAYTSDDFDDALPWQGM